MGIGLGSITVLSEEPAPGACSIIFAFLLTNVRLLLAVEVDDEMFKVRNKTKALPLHFQVAACTASLAQSGPNDAVRVVVVPERRNNAIIVNRTHDPSTVNWSRRKANSDSDTSDEAK